MTDENAPDTPEPDEPQNTPAGQILRPMTLANERDPEHETLEDLAEELEKRKTE